MCETVTRSDTANRHPASRGRSERWWQPHHQRRRILRTHEAANVMVFSYAAHHCYGPSLQRLIEDAVIQERVDTIYSLDATSEHGWTKVYSMPLDTYGAPRIEAELAASVHPVGRKQVARLMRRASLTGLSRLTWMATTVHAVCARLASDLIARHYSAAGPDRVWVADATYIPTWVGCLYLVVIDVFSCRVVGGAMATHLRMELRLAALNMVRTQRRPKDVIHHSD